MLVGIGYEALNIAEIGAGDSLPIGSGNPDGRDDFSTGTGRDQEEMRLYHARVNGIDKWFMQGKGTRMWHCEGEFGPFTQGASGNSSLDNRCVDMSENYLIAVNSSSSSTTIEYIRTDNDDWKTNSFSWSSTKINKGYEIEIIHYDPVKKEWLGTGRTGKIKLSKDGLNWETVGAMGKGFADRNNKIVRQSSGKYS